MIIPLEDLARFIAVIDSVNATDPKLLRYKFLDNLMANESQLSNIDYGRELVKFIINPPQGTPS